VSLADTTLGRPFSGGDLFEWLPASGASPGALRPARLQALGIQRNQGEVSLYFRLPAEIVIEVRRGPSVVTIIPHEPSTPVSSTVLASAAPLADKPSPAQSAVVVAAEAPDASTAAPAPVERAPEPEAPPKLTPVAAAELLRALFPTAPSEAAAPPISPQGSFLAAPTTDAEATHVASAGELYRKLFPSAPPEAQEAPAVEIEARPLWPRTLDLRFLTLRPSLRTTYTRGRATLETAQPVTTSYLEIHPGVDLETVFGAGRLMLGYEPYFRALSSYDLVERTTHRMGARLDLTLGNGHKLKVTDTFISGVLETEEVDPGYEYFFGLSRFRRNTVGVNGSFEVVPRLSIEAGGIWSAVRFDDPVGFFPYDSRTALLGLGYELTPSLRTTLGYVYDRVPPPDQRPLAEATAHSVQAAATGDITPLLSGQLTLAYRDQTSPRAPESGRHFRGLTASASLTRSFGTASSLRLSASRATPVSNFENNAFYVSTHADVSLVQPLPFALWLESGIGHRWNDYRTDAVELGRPRHDGIFGWRVGLRRAIGPAASFAFGYRRYRRRSNLDSFDSTTDGLILELGFNIFGASGGQ
jgi:hypothetical protein